MKARSYLFLFISFFYVLSLDAQITGTVFRDYNNNGIQDGREPGVYNVIVQAYEDDNAISVGSTNTGVNGSYSLTGLSAGVDYRIEFTWTYTYLQSGPSGGTSVQFGQDGEIINMGLVNPGEHTPVGYKSSAKLFTSCYILGPYNSDIFPADPSLNLPTRDALVQWSFTEGNLPPNLDGIADAIKTTLATHGDIGATWGLVYDPINDDLYASAYLKRHSGFGPGGPSAIYKIDLDNSNTVSTWYSDGINFGLGPHPPAGTICTDIADGDMSEFNCWLYDIQSDASLVSESYDLQGKMSWGDIDITEDYKNIVGVNMLTKELYIIPINSVGGAGTAIKTIIPTPGCAGGDANNWRPAGVAVKDAKVYVGGVCSGETTQSRTDMAAYIYYYDLNTGSWNTTPVLSFDFNETSGTSWGACWEAWINTNNWDESSSAADCASEMTKYYQPFISDIEFDNGAMIIGIKDRNGDLLGDEARPPIHDPARPNESDGLFSGITRGYIARACYDPVSDSYELESNGGFTTCSGLTTSGDNNGREQGPDQGEYYWGQHQFDNDGTESTRHQQSTWGGLYQMDGCEEIGSTAMNPIDANQVSDGGVWFLSNDSEDLITFAGVSNVIEAGTKTRQVRIYDGSGDPAVFDKTSGLGDLEGTSTIAPIEIGNYVWFDNDMDGIQDPSENAISGLEIQLLQGATVIATATTDANGNYYFSSGAGTTTASAIYGITQLEPNMSYIVRIPNVQGGSKQAALGVNNLTTANVGGAGQPDVRDSDGTLVGNNADVTVMTTDIPTAGANNHNFDFGFSMVACVTPTATASSTNPTCVSGAAQSNGMITISGFTAGQRYQYTSGATFSGTATPASITAIPVGGVIVNNLANTTQQYTVRIYDATDNACFVDRVVSITAAVCGDCNCTDMIYLNDETGDVVHKFSLDATSGSLSEIGSPWLDNPPGINNPHGIAIDLNGFVYIASAGNPIVNPPWDSHFNGGKVFKLQADGTMINPNPDPTAVNFTEWNANWGTENGILYVPNAVDETVDAYELCSGTYIGSMFAVNNGGDVQTWGFYVENGKWYWPNQSDGGVFTGSTDLNLYTIPATNSGVVLFNHGINPDIFLSATPLGMTRDAAGNFYIIRGAIGGGAAEIRKYNPAGTFITSVSDNSGSANATNGLPGFYGARGIAYSKMTNKLYVGSFENCVSVFDTDLVQQTALNIGNPTNGRPKGIGILTECCPTVANETIDKVVCSNGNGEKVFLQNLLDCGEGTIGEGNWVEVTNTSGGNIEFNECDLSITVNGSGCATYTLSKISPSGGNQQCGPFSITLNICTEVPSATVAGAQGTCTGANPNNDVLINITSTMNADEAGISTGATYTGPAYGNAANIDISGGFGSFTGRMHNTQYTVRIFNGSNDCYVDYTVTTPTIVCCALTVVCTPQPQTNCSPINGSASVVASNAVGTVTYLWSSGETTSTISNKAAATYTVTVTDGGVAGCSRTCEAIIANNASAPTCAITVNSQPSCANLTGGSITVVPSPAGTYTYAWSDNGAATATRSGLTGGTYTVTVTNTTSNCTGVCNVTLTTPTNCCNISAITAINLECIDNGTPALITDNRIRFSANVTNTNTSLTGYNVTINGGTTITPNTNVPYGVTQFTLGPGTAGGGATFTITVTDSATPGCSQTFQVVDPGNCTPVLPECPPVKCGTATIQVNGN